MFHHIEGKVTDIGQNFAVIDCSGVGFGLNATTNTLSRLALGEKAKLYTYSHIREDTFDLYGFLDIREKRSFEMLIGVSGVGPKAAVSILSAATPESLAMAVISGNEKALMIAPGIGKKIAQRILLELKDKISKETDGIISVASPGQLNTGLSTKLSDSASALAVLGYSNAEISHALKDLDMENTELEDIIRQALKKMVK